MVMIDWAIAITVITALILASLLFIYVNNYKRIRSHFCSGLIIFAVLLLIQNVYAIHVQTTMTPQCSTELAGAILIINLLEGVGLGALLFITLKPYK